MIAQPPTYAREPVVMMRVKCPKCASALGISETPAGSVASCPKCGQKFRLPTNAEKPSASSRPEAVRQPKAASTDDTPTSRPAARTIPARPPPAVADQPDQGLGVLPFSDRPEPSRARERPQVTDDRDEQDEEERDHDDETPRPRKRKKKKKKKKPEPRELNPAHIVLVVVGLLVVAGVTGLFLLIQHGVFAKAKPDPAQVLADLQRIGAHIERDQKSPEQPVVGLNLSGLEYDARLLDKLVAFPQLRKLNLAQTKTSDLSLEHLEKVTSLEVLILSHTKVTGGGMQFLKNLVNLEELNLNQTLVTDPSLQALKGLTKLKKLNLDGTLASGLELMAAIPGLKVVK